MRRPLPLVSLLAALLMAAGCGGGSSGSKKTTGAASSTPAAVELDADKAPKTSASVAYLVRKGFYDGLTFHRIADGFVIQGGDPRGDGTGGPGYKVRERPPGNTRYVRGVVAMAKAGNEPAGTSG